MSAPQLTPSQRPLDLLEETIRARAAALEGDASLATSYTAKLLAGGVEKIGSKVVEEAGEFVEAASEPMASSDNPEGNDHFIHEAADLLYHVLVLLRHRRVDLTDVEAKLASRFGISGLEEKASRAQQDNSAD